MNNQTLIIYDFQVLFDIFNEIKTNLNFNLINISKKDHSKLELEKIDNYLIISNKKIKNLENQFILDNFPLKISKLIETINIIFLKRKFNEQSEINLGSYKLNLNSRKIFNNNKNLNLTEKEANIIMYLKNSNKPVTIAQLQYKVWGHNSKLETHTVETHIYRLRKKIIGKFGDNNFIKSSKLGYNIK
tara:strand:- start:132 stop:695 length:564 start_codon:yes stop_codon:yes gene_type:complete